MVGDGGCGANRFDSVRSAESRLVSIPLYEGKLLLNDGLKLDVFEACLESSKLAKFRLSLLGLAVPASSLLSTGWIESLPTVASGDPFEKLALSSQSIVITGISGSIIIISSSSSSSSVLFTFSSALLPDVVAVVRDLLLDELLLGKSENELLELQFVSESSHDHA